MQYERLTLTTDASGDATVYTKRPISGHLQGLYFTLGTLTSGAVDVVVTQNETTAAVLTITNGAANGWYKPMIPVYGTGGTAALYAAGGTAVLEDMPVNGNLKVVVAQGGNATTGYLDVYTD